MPMVGVRRTIHHSRIILKLRSMIADWRLEPQRGIIITGSPRSGTTLALRIYCPDLTPEEEHAGSAFNEPQPLSNLILQGNVGEALLLLPITMLNRHHLIKSPHMALLLPYVKPKYRVIVTFRDLRLIVPSMLRHPNARRLELSDNPYWAKYASVKIPDDPIMKAALVAELFYRSIVAYAGPIEVWNYGFWHEWVVRNKRIAHLYDRVEETSPPVVQDVREGKIFSNKRFTIRAWQEFCADFGVIEAQQLAICEANERIKRLYQEHGLQVKTLDDSHDCGLAAEANS